MKGFFKTIWYVLTLRCEEADRIRAISPCADATRAERFGAWAHTMICRACWAARKQADRLDQLLTMTRDRERTEGWQSTNVEASAEMRSRLLKAIDKAER